MHEWTKTVTQQPKALPRLFRRKNTRIARGEKWNPPFCGDLDHGRSNATAPAFYQRHPDWPHGAVKLFASI